jgi:hypothetical protein
MDTIPGLMVRQGTDEQFYTHLSARTVQIELCTYCIRINSLETALHLILDIDVDAVFSKTRDSSVQAVQTVQTVPDGSGV